MAFVLRLIDGLGLGILIVATIAGLLLLSIWILNRGAQLFFGLFGYEVKDFFSYILKSIGITKKKPPQ